MALLLSREEFNEVEGVELTSAPFWSQYSTFGMRHTGGGSARRVVRNGVFTTDSLIRDGLPLSILEQDVSMTCRFNVSGVAGKIQIGVIVRATARLDAANTFYRVHFHNSNLDTLSQGPIGQYLIIDRVDFDKNPNFTEIVRTNISGFTTVVPGSFFDIRCIASSIAGGTGVLLRTFLNGVPVQSRTDISSDALTAGSFGGIHYHIASGSGSKKDYVEANDWQFSNAAAQDQFEVPPALIQEMAKAPAAVGDEGTAVETLPVVPDYAVVTSIKFLTRTLDTDGGYDITINKFATGRRIYRLAFNTLKETEKDTLRTFFEDRISSVEPFFFDVPNTSPAETREVFLRSNTVSFQKISTGPIGGIYRLQIVVQEKK